MEESPSPLLSLDASRRSCKHGNESDNFHDAIITSRALEENISTVHGQYNSQNRKRERAITSSKKVKVQSSPPKRRQQALRQDSSKIKSNATPHPTTMENLPEELLLNIFIRLMAKQLSQMRSVSKYWNTLLSHSSFIKSHLNHSVHNNDQILLVFYYMKNTDHIEPFTTHSCRYPHIKLTNYIQPPVNPQHDCTRIRIIGAVNGLICSSYNDDSVIHIWNPSLSAVITLPPPYLTPCHDDDKSISSFFQFGFDPKTDDYKVFKLTGNRIEIYSMRKGSWELISETFPSHITGFIGGYYVCVDGHDGILHWVCLVGENTDLKRTILTFDLGAETFCEIPLPGSSLGFMYGFLGGKLCVLSWFEDRGGLEVWVMDEYGVPESWVKRHVFSQFGGYTYPFGFTSHSKLLLQDDSRNLILYDPIAKKPEIFKTTLPEEGEGWPVKIVEYVDSLVWVTPAKREIAEDARQS